MEEVIVMTDSLRIKWNRLSYGGYFSVPHYGTIDKDLFDRLMKFQSDISTEDFFHFETYQERIREKLAMSGMGTVWQFNARFKKGVTKDGVTDNCEYVRMCVYLGNYGYHNFSKLHEVTKFDIYKWKALNAVCSVLNAVTKLPRALGAK